MNVRTSVAAIGVGSLIALSVPATANAVDAYPVGVTPVTCSAKAVKNASKIKVNMGPNQPDPTRSYKFYVDVKKSGKWYRYLKAYKTQGTAETRTVNVPKGTYRIRCIGDFGFINNTSGNVKIKK